MMVSQTPRTARALSPSEMKQFLMDTLDEMPITEIDYHNLAYTRPLVTELLLRVAQHAPQGGRVLVLGPDPLLAEGLVNLGYAVDLWRLGEYLFPEHLSEHVRGTLQPDALLNGALPLEGGRYDAIVLPMVFEHLAANPQRLLERVEPVLERGGVVVTATANLGRLGSRLRALLGKGFLPDWKGPPQPVTMNWPALPLVRLYQPDELMAWSREAGLEVVEAAFTEGHSAFNDLIPLTVLQYLVLKAKYAIKRRLPPLQDFVLLVLRRPGEALSAADGPPLAIPEGPLGAFLTAPQEERRTRLPFVSVVLPTKDRAHLLPTALSSLFEQTYPADRYEIVVINDGSSDNTKGVYDELAPTAPCAMRYVETEGLGTAAARNLGVRHGQGDIIAHTDDDSVLPPGWLEAGVMAFEPGVAIVSGPILPRSDQQMTFFSWVMVEFEDNGTYPTSNIFYRRDLFDLEAGFDESFGTNMLGRPVWGWDTDLAWRLRRKGYEVRFTQEALIYSEIFMLTPKRWLLESWRATMIPPVVRAVPELRRTLLKGRFFFATNALQFELGLLGSALAVMRRNPLFAVVWLPWLTFALKLARGDWWPPFRWPKLVPKVVLLFAQHVVLLVALLVGSMRAKRLVM